MVARKENKILLMSCMSLPDLMWNTTRYCRIGFALFVAPSFKGHQPVSNLQIRHFDSGGR